MGLEEQEDSLLRLCAFSGAVVEREALVLGAGGGRDRGARQATGTASALRIVGLPRPRRDLLWACRCRRWCVGGYQERMEW